MKYGCHNNPRRDVAGEYPVQDGWTYHELGTGGTLTREPIIKMQPDVMNLPCAYDKSAGDAMCSGCRRAQPPRGSQVDPAMALPSEGKP